MAGSEPAVSNPSHPNLALLLKGHPRASLNIQSISEHAWRILRLLPSCLLRLGITVPSRNPIFDALAPSSRAAPISPYRRDFRCSQLFFTGSAESTCDLTSLCVFLGATFDHHFGGFGDGQKNVRTVECVKKRPRFSLTKTVFFASNFEAIPESNPIFGDPRQETFMAARLRPNLRMAESTLR